MTRPADAGALWSLRAARRRTTSHSRGVYVIAKSTVAFGWIMSQFEPPLNKPIPTETVSIVNIQA